MRVFLPSTLPALAATLKAGQVSPAASADPPDTERGAEPGAYPGLYPGPLSGFAVTPALREAYASGDEDELEYAALTEAARASLRMIEADPAAPPRRVVLAAELPAEHVRWDPRDREPARVLIDAPITLARLASGLVDGPEAVADVRAAADALSAADAGDADAQFTVDGAEGYDLGWYATQELPYLTE